MPKHGVSVTTTCFAKRLLQHQLSQHISTSDPLHDLVGCPQAPLGACQAELQ